MKGIDIHVYNENTHIVLKCIGEKTTVYTRVQVERVYKSNPIFEAKNTTFLEKVWFFSFHQLNKINRWSGIQG